MYHEEITIDIEAIRQMPNESVSDAETIRQIGLYCIQNRDVSLANKIDSRFEYVALYPHLGKYNITPDTPLLHTKEHILSELRITEDVLAIYQYGSRVYGTADKNSDYDYIIVMKRGMLENGAFRNNAISNDDRTIQGVVYSRGGFIDAINNYDIGALECLSLPKENVIFNKWPFKVSEWNENAMVKAIIAKASNSRHNADQQSKNGNKWIGKKSMYHALRILYFGMQLKEHQKIIDFSECNEMYEDFMHVEDAEFDTRDYYDEFDELLTKLRE
jgi:hypothetical protein